MSADLVARFGHLLVAYQLLDFGVRTEGHSGAWVVHGPDGTERGLQIYVVDGDSAPGGICSWGIVQDPGMDIVALVDIASERVWLLEATDVQRLSKAQADGSRLIYTYAMPTFDAEKTGHAVFTSDFDALLLPNQVTALMHLAP